MNTARYGDESPIYALATGRGGGAIAVIRLSGVGTLELLAKVFSKPDALLGASAYTILHGYIEKEKAHAKTQRRKEYIDEVLVSVFRAPYSYTGEESAEISCHGGPAVVRAVEAVLGEAGFREALPGEFTFRAFQNGKVDLTEAEAVMELVGAEGEAARESALGRLAGALEAEISGLKSGLVEALARLEFSLDYPDDEIADEMNKSGEDGEQIGLIDLSLLKNTRKKLETLAESYKLSRLYTEGALVVIAGRPNAGKSSLFNRLLKEDRSIVTPIPGATRDWIEARFEVKGIPLRLADTAGLRSTGDEVEQLGVERSKKLLEAADIVLYLIDGETGVTEDDVLSTKETKDTKISKYIFIWNKADKNLPAYENQSLCPSCPLWLILSATTGQGMEDLYEALGKRLGEIAREQSPGHSASSTGLGTERQKALVEEALGNIAETISLAEKGEAAELIAPVLREAVNNLGEITGEVATDDILEVIFSKFCVGK
ncbi:MAG: tRNA uridine-5-carboxymethylaminomethyl(34) synthesis GTPase MnmE [Spirochaetaceae bacterium]|nr:tRNA uridine-5-carboxymethylaminomethyl(34) synthesis GTPase MnmE [Spirochaetaceae bacterium]